jgi:hypothetical protein
MTALALIQRQLKKQQKIGDYPFLRWKLAREKANATAKTMGEAVRRP